MSLDNTVKSDETTLLKPINNNELGHVGSEVTENNIKDVTMSLVMPDTIEYKTVASLPEPMGDAEAFQIQQLIRKDAENKAIRKRFNIKGKLSNGVSYGDMRMYQSSLKPKLNVDPNKLTDEQKMELINSKTGGGNGKVIPLWNSGFIIILRQMDNLEIINFEKKLGSTILLKAAYTGGLVMTGIQFQYRELLMEIINDHLISTTLKVPNLMEIGKYIVPEDWPLIENGIMSMMYPNGIETTRTCTGILNDKPCYASHLVKLYNDNIVKVDWSRLTPEMFKIIGERRPNTITPSDLKAYREALNPNISTEIILKTEGDDITLILKWPNILDISLMGEAWLNKLRESINDIINTDYDDEDEDEELAKRSLTTPSGAWLAYLDAIKLGEIIVTDKDLIYKKLNDILGIGDNDKLVADKLEEMAKNRALAFIGVTDFRCDNCKTTQEVNENNYVVIDGYGMLLESLALRIRKLQEHLTNL